METAAVILVVIVILAALSMEMKLSRANRIARASHDLLKGMAESLKQIAEAQKEAKVWKAPPLPEVNAPEKTPRQSEAATVEKVYRID